MRVFLWGIRNHLVHFVAAFVATAPFRMVSAKSGISFCTMQNARLRRLQAIVKGDQ